MDVSLLRARRAVIGKAMQDVINLTKSEGRDLTSDEAARIDAMVAESTGLKESVERADRAMNAAAESAASTILAKESGRHKYSIIRAVNCLFERQKLDGLEGEVNTEIERTSGRKAQGFWFPTSLPVGTVQRAFDAGTTGTGLKQVRTADTFIDVLRNKMLLSALGVTYMSDLVGELDIPKKTGATTAYWISSEGGAPSESEPTAAGQVKLSANTVGAYTDVTRRLIKEGGESAEALVLNDLALSLAAAVDAAGLAGTGSGGQPTGVLNAAGIGTTALGTNGLAPTFANSVIAQEAALVANNADIGNLAYVTSGRGKITLKQVQRASGTGMVWEGSQVNGYSAFSSNAIPSNLTKGSGTGLSAMIFGNWADLVVGQWGVVDIKFNPVAAGTSGTVRIIALQDVDIEIRRAESFNKIIDMLA